MLFNQTFSWDMPDFTTFDQNLNTLNPCPSLPLIVSFSLGSFQFLNLYNSISLSSQNSLLLDSRATRYLFTHIRFATTLYMTPLTEMFSYEVRGSNSLQVVRSDVVGNSQLIITGYSKERSSVYDFKTDLIAASLTTKLLLNTLLKYYSPFHQNGYRSDFKTRVYAFISIVTHLYKKDINLVSSAQGFLVYQFHQISSLERIFIFTTLKSTTYWSTGDKSKKRTLDAMSPWGVSVSQLFSSARWLEREAVELFGIQLLGMFDRRNLLLQYGETSSPLKKSYPSAGWYEVYYVPTYGALVERSLTPSE